MLTREEILKGVISNPDYGRVGGKTTKDLARKIAVSRLDMDLRWYHENETDTDTVVEYFFHLLQADQTRVLTNLSMFKKALGQVLYGKYENDLVNACLTYKKAVKVV